MSCCSGSNKRGGPPVANTKACASTASCSTHKHRPRVQPCPNPDKCYANTRKKKQKCASASSIVSKRGMPCTCAKVQADASRSSTRSGGRKRPEAIVDTGIRRKKRCRKKKKCCVVL